MAFISAGQQLFSGGFLFHWFLYSFMTLSRMDPVFCGSVQFLLSVIMEFWLLVFFEEIISGRLRFVSLSPSLLFLLSLVSGDNDALCMMYVYWEAHFWGPILDV